jgi:hypothetical protein
VNIGIGFRTPQLPIIARLALLAGLLGSVLPAQAQQPTAEQAGAIRQACRADYQRNCSGVPTGGDAALACLKQNAAKLSAGCQQAMRAASGGAAASASAPPAATRAAAPAAASAQAIGDRWPHTATGPDGGVATIYQPQVIAWPERQNLDTRIAMALQAPGAKAPTYGVIDVAFVTQTDLASRTVTLTAPRLTAVNFPTLGADAITRLQGQIINALAAIGVKRVPLDTLLVSLRDQTDKPQPVPVKNDPPAIYYSARPASLIVFDGEPVLAPINGTPLSYAVNTNWDVFFDSGARAWYVLNNGGWLVAPDAKGPWKPATKLPPAFAALPSDANFADVKKSIPGRVIAANDAPTVFVSTVPAEIIVTMGPPNWQPIPRTTLRYAANSDAAVFRDDASGRIYFLVSGRWFSAASVDGPWTYATESLPADFARIPPDSPRGFVLVSVPGTPQAQEALIQAQVPQQATLSRASAKVEIVYAGPPKFEPIPTTQLMYAVNTSFDVIRVGDVYYACVQGAWFTAPTPNGPWVLAATIPAAIYAIPPSSPLYRVTYVKVYAETPEVVTYGYTAGYTMGYVSAGVVVYGTGWYYPPVIYPGPIPIYYPYPYSYAGATYYNSATGAWARGGAIYGPYGGVAKAGTAYNPNTGAWAHGGAVYGPNGGAGAFSAYNPTTGSYAHGSAVWGPDGASGNASWYNARTGVSGTTNQNSNAYGRWGSSTINTQNQTIHTQSQSNAQGSAGSFSSSSGAKGGAVSGAGGNTAGAVKTSGGDVYAGADGNVYKKTDSGWEKYDNGSWNQVQKPSTANTQASGARTSSSTTPSSSSQSNLSGQTQRASAAQSSGTEQRTSSAQSSSAEARSQASGSSDRFSGANRSEGFGQLDRDNEARSAGAARQQQFQRGGGSAGRGGGAFRR